MSATVNPGHHPQRPITTHKSPKFELQLANAIPTNLTNKFPLHANKFNPTNEQTEHTPILHG